MLGAATAGAGHAALAREPRPQVLETALQGRFTGGCLTVHAERVGGTVRLSLSNSYDIAVTADFDFTLDNLEPVSVPRTVAVPAGRTIEAATFRLAHPDRAFDYHYVMHWLFGDRSATPVDTVYELPFAPGRGYRVLQGYYGAFSHHDVAAVDWGMPEGTPVVAAREGLVVAYNDTATTGGLEPEFRVLDMANWVVIRHPDGTLGCYFHLAPHGVSVTPGQTVQRGQLLGRSGNTGFSSTPHLHFEVRTPIDGAHFRTYPVRFRTRPGDEVGEVPLEGRVYQAL